MGLQWSLCNLCSLWLASWVTYWGHCVCSKTYCKNHSLMMSFLHTLFLSQKKSFTFCYWTVKNANRAMRTIQRSPFETDVVHKILRGSGSIHTTRTDFPTQNSAKGHPLHPGGNFTSTLIQIIASNGLLNVIFTAPCVTVQVQGGRTLIHLPAWGVQRKF